jgi:hypothetical protein
MGSTEYTSHGSSKGIPAMRPARFELATSRSGGDSGNRPDVALASDVLAVLALGDGPTMHRIYWRFDAI